ncbi:magnesium transporter [Mycena leptocephala]|nr:magnesium transporter [Mycena leptocephala]
MPRENSFSDSDGRSLTPTSKMRSISTHPRLPPMLLLCPINLPSCMRLTQGIQCAPEQLGFILPAQPLFIRRTVSLCRAEPGVDPRRASADAEYGGIKQECVIEVVDYSAVRSSFGRMTNREFVDLMNNPDASARDPWVKVRWINIAGMSWDVIKAHLFLRLLCHELSEESTPTLTGVPRFESSAPLMSETSEDEKALLGGSLRKRRAKSQSRSSEPHLRRSLDVAEMRAAAVATDEQRRIQEAALKALKSGERVNVNVVPMFIFLFRDGTVISIHSTPSLEMTEPITHRLRQFDTVLRTSADPSLLVQSLLGLITDKALEVVTAYQDKIKKFERTIMSKPTIDTVRNLHILSADLILHRRTLAPLKTVVYGLRRYDIDRAAALIDESVKDIKDVKVGFMTQKSLIYLADVHDHLEHVLSQLDMIAGVGQNLVDYTFNMTSYEMNEIMRRLMLVTVIFLPLTLLTGYFGMNFDNMWSVKHGHGDWIYWAIALPIMAIVLPLFLAPDIQRMVHHVRKQMLTQKVVKSFKSV